VTALVAALIAGTIPGALPSPSSVLWVASTGEVQESGCTLQRPRRWICEELPPDAHGLVVIVDASGTLGYALVNVDGPPGDAAFAWGRILQVVPGGVAPGDLGGLEGRAWKPARPPFRPRTERFVAVEDGAVRIVPLSETVFWVVAAPTDDDAYLTIAGPAVATLYVPLVMLANGPVGAPVVVSAAAPFPLAGRVQTPQGVDVDGADVELLRALSPSLEAPGDRRPSFVRVGETRTDADGQFVFSRIEPGTYRVAARHPSLGRGVAEVRSLSDPPVVMLAPPARVVGRVLRHRQPVANARVRFVPRADALMASADSTRLVAPDTETEPDGRFSLALPPDRSGVVQIVGPDGASARFGLVGPPDARQFDLGDLMLPELRRLTVRLLDALLCTVEAAGPLGGLSLAIVRPQQIGQVYWFDLPETGEWVLGARCDGRTYLVEPPAIVVSDADPDPTVDIRLVR